MEGEPGMRMTVAHWQTIDAVLDNVSSGQNIPIDAEVANRARLLRRVGWDAVARHAGLGRGPLGWPPADAELELRLTDDDLAFIRSTLNDSIPRIRSLLDDPLDDQSRSSQGKSLRVMLAARDAVDALIAQGSGYVMHELGSRARMQPAPEFVVWASLTRPRDPAARPWLDLLDHEIEPRIIDSAEPFLVVWSSLWPDLPEVTVRFDIQPAGQGCRLRWTLLTTGAVPSAGRLGHMRYRLNVLINERLRLSYGQ